MDVRYRRAGGVALLSLAATLNGCITTTPFDTHRTMTAHQRPIAKEHAPEGFLSLERVVLETHPKFSVQRITIPASVTNQETVVDYYTATHQRPRPLIIMSPPLGTIKPGTSSPYERPFLTYFAKQGWDAALVYRPMFPQTNDPIEDLEHGMLIAVQSYRRAIDVVSEQPNVRLDRLCAFGISMGSLIATVSAAQDSRIKYTVIALGGSTDKILENADEKNPEVFLRRVASLMQTYGGKERFLKQFRERSKTQPQHYAHQLDPKNTLLVISKRDKIIPLDAAEDLRSRAGYPTTRYIHVLGHIGSFILYPRLRKETLDFFENRMAEDDAKALLMQESAGGGS